MKEYLDKMKQLNEEERVLRDNYAEDFEDLLEQFYEKKNEFIKEFIDYCSTLPSDVKIDAKYLFNEPGVFGLEDIEINDRILIKLPDETNFTILLSKVDCKSIANFVKDRILDNPIDNGMRTFEQISGIYALSKEVQNIQDKLWDIYFDFDRLKIEYDYRFYTEDYFPDYIKNALSDLESAKNENDERQCEIVLKALQHYWHVSEYYIDMAPKELVYYAIKDYDKNGLNKENLCFRIDIEDTDEFKFMIVGDNETNGFVSYDELTENQKQLVDEEWDLVNGIYIETDELTQEDKEPEWE